EPEDAVKRTLAEVQPLLPKLAEELQWRGVRVGGNQLPNPSADRVRHGRTAHSAAAPGRLVIGRLQRALTCDPANRPLGDAHLPGHRQLRLPRLQQGEYGITIDHPEHPFPPPKRAHARPAGTGYSMVRMPLDRPEFREKGGQNLGNAQLGRPLRGSAGAPPRVFLSAFPQPLLDPSSPELGVRSAAENSLP